VNDLELYYQEYGDENAPLVVFLHGGGVSSWMWDKQVDYFTSYHCVTIDLPEQGESTQSGYFSIRYSAEKVIELLEKLADGKEIIVIGFSLGAQVAIQMLSMKPNLIDHAVITSALVRPNALVRKMIPLMIKTTFPLLRNRSFSKLQSKVLYIDEDYFEIYYKETSQMKSDTLIRILKENMSFKVPSDFTKAKTNILVTVGEKEKAIMKKSANDIVSSNSNCTGVIIPNVGHGISLQDPHYFNEMIEKWLQGSVLQVEVSH
jgi:pimeloyl-ACP methyl ester carboxylesterase